MKYKTLAELKAAFDNGELPRAPDGMEAGWGSCIALDGDMVYLYVDGTKVYSSHPENLLAEALDLLDIPWEHV